MFINAQQNPFCRKTALDNRAFDTVKTVKEVNNLENITLVKSWKPCLIYGEMLAEYRFAANLNDSHGIFAGKLVRFSVWVNEDLSLRSVKVAFCKLKSNNKHVYAKYSDLSKESKRKLFF